MNCAARLVFRASRRDHISPLLSDSVIGIGFLLIKEFGIRFLHSASMLSLVPPLHTSLTCYRCTSLWGHCAPLQILELSEFLANARSSRDSAPFLTLALSSGTVFPSPSAMLRHFLLLNPNSRLICSVNQSSICPWPFHLLPWCDRGWLGVESRLSICLFISFVCVCVFHLYFKRPRLSWEGAR